MHSCRAGDSRGLLDPSALPALPVPSAPGLEQQSCPESLQRFWGCQLERARNGMRRSQGWKQKFERHRAHISFSSGSRTLH